MVKLNCACRVQAQWEAGLIDKYIKDYMVNYNERYYTFE